MDILQTVLIKLEETYTGYKEAEEGFSKLGHDNFAEEMKWASEETLETIHRAKGLQGVPFSELSEEAKTWLYKLHGRLGL